MMVFRFKGEHQNTKVNICIKSANANTCCNSRDGSKLCTNTRHVAPNFFAGMFRATRHESSYGSV